MRRVVLGFAVCAGMLVMGVTNASAGGYCSLDPTLGVGLPVHTHVIVKASVLGIVADLYVYNSSRSTTFGGGIGLP
jgi:hypothetical protein